MRPAPAKMGAGTATDPCAHRFSILPRPFMATKSPGTAIAAPGR